MKKLISILLTTLVLLSCPVTAFAAETTVNQESEQVDIGVYAKYEQKEVWDSVPTDDNGNAKATLPDGTEVTVSGITDKSWRLVVEPVTATEKAAFDWMTGCVSGKAKNCSAFYVFFLGADGKEHPASGVTVTLKLPSKLAAPVAYSLDKSSAATKLDSTSSDGLLTFKANGSPYYILGEKVSGGDSTKPGTDPTKPGTDSPKTGDDTNLVLWIVVLIVSAAGMIVLIVFFKKKKHKTE